MKTQHTPEVPTGPWRILDRNELPVAGDETYDKFTKTWQTVKIPSMHLAGGTRIRGTIFRRKIEQMVPMGSAKSNAIIAAHQLAQSVVCKKDEAKLRLEKAAPDLLAALKELRDCISETRGRSAWEAVIRADAAIAKAEQQ